RRVPSNFTSILSCSLSTSTLFSYTSLFRSHGITPCLRLFVHVQVCLYPRKSDSLMNVPFLVSPRLSLISSYAYCKHSCNDQPCCCANIIKVTTVSPIPSFKSSGLLRDKAAPTSPASS